MITSANCRGASMAYFAAVIFFRALVNFFYRVAPKALGHFDHKLMRKFRAKLFLPATGRYHHSLPVKIGSFTFNIPTRDQTLIIVGFVIFDILILFCDHQLIWPNFLFPSLEAQYSKSLGNRSGMLVLSTFTMSMLFAGRNNILIWITGWPLEAFSVFHKWISRVLMFNVLVHGISYSLNHAISGTYASSWQQGYFAWGAVACILIWLLGAQSVHYLRSMAYEMFLVVHIVLVAVLVPAAYYHVKHMDDGLQYVYTSIALWGFDRAMRIARVVNSGITSRAEIRLHGSVVKFTIDYSQRWNVYAGCYVFVHVLHSSKFWQSHPFTVTVSPKPEDKGKLVLFSRVKKGITKHMQEYLLKRDNHSTSVPVLIDGPYGTHHAVQHYDTLVLIAGGIGITSIYPYAAELAKSPDRQQRVVLVWTISDESPLDWFCDQIDQMASDVRIEMHIHVTTNASAMSSDINLVSQSSDGGEEEKEEENASKSTVSRKYGRRDLKRFVQEEMTTSKGSIVFLACGPDSMNDDIRWAVSHNIEMASGRVDYFEESFSW